MTNISLRAFQHNLNGLKHISCEEFITFQSFEKKKRQKKNLVKFDSVCDMYNVIQDDVFCRLFFLTREVNYYE